MHTSLYFRAFLVLQIIFHRFAVMTKWLEIPGFSSYVVGSSGVVKRKKRRANGDKYRILAEMFVKVHANKQGFLYFSLIDDSGKQRVVGLEKLMASVFIGSGRTVYRIHPSKFRSVDYIDSEMYDKINCELPIYKTIKT